MTQTFFQFQIFLSMIHYFTVVSGVNAAPGDSGGPLMFQVHHKWYVRGVVSLGIEQQRVGYSMFTDVQHHRPWLVSKRRRVEGRTRH
jgi:secreted trypsin-like serine protease